jgi:hypothetical protein
MSRRIPVKVEFCGSTLEGVISSGRAYVAMRPITEAMGLSWPAQLAKIKAHPVLTSTVAEIATVGPDGRVRKMICLPESRLQFWMALIQTGKVKASLRGKIVKFQIEAADVLHRAFNQGVAETNRHVLALDSKRAAGRLMNDITKDALILAGKAPKPHHFINEHRMVNWVLTGTFAGVTESTADSEQIEHLASLRRRNSVLIGSGMAYERRKLALESLAAEWRALRPDLVVADHGA